MFGIALWKRVLVGLLLGLALGIVWPQAAPWIAFMGDLFVRAIRMLVERTRRDGPAARPRVPPQRKLSIDRSSFAVPTRGELGAAAMSSVSAR